MLESFIVIVIYCQIQSFFADEYAFRSTRSTTAAVIAILHTRCSLLSTSPYVHVFCTWLHKSIWHFTT